MVERTEQYLLVLPLVLASGVAYGVAEFMRDPPIYHSLLERELCAARGSERLTQPLLLELSIAPGVLCVGRRVRDLALPPGCLLIAIERTGTKIVPTADAALAAGDRIHVILAPDASEVVTLLHTGTGT